MIIPVLHRLLIKPDNVEEADETLKRARSAGILLELDKREKAAVETGVVVAVGPTVFKHYEGSPEDVPVGSKVYFAKYSGKEVKENGETFLLVNDDDIVAIIKD